MTIVIIEGCDAAGKTTLIDMLRQQLPDFVVKKGSSFEHSKCDQNELYFKFRELLGLEVGSFVDDNIIFDRFIYSNEVYASLYDDYAILSDEQRRRLEEIIAHEAIVVYLYASPIELQRRLNSRGDDYVKADRIPAILQKYNESLMKVHPRLDLISFDTEVNSTEQMVKVIIEEINRKTEDSIL